MKLASVLLRWYRSFHVNYKGDSQRGEALRWQPWNSLIPEYLDQGDFPFIELPIEPDITTIVGANESGKSHLLNAITKAITGRGLETTDKFRKTDLCHYASVRTKNIEAAPQIGLVFRVDGSKELDPLSAIVNQTLGANRSSRFSLIVEPLADGSEHGWLYIEPDTQAFHLDSASLIKVRALLPKVQFIDSQAQLSSEIALTQLMAGYGIKEYSDVAIVERRGIEEIIKRFAALPAFLLNGDNSDLGKKTTELKDEIAKSGIKQKPQTLELLLFRNILGITGDTLKYIHKLSAADRGFIEGQVSKWNDELDEKLNLTHFWRQDEQFGLRFNLKDGIVYFEIRDKTDSVYTFKERSSGLRYFLSYYIQARAIEMQQLNQNSLILMDEPDSALSVVGQRNLLSVFESLIRPESSRENCQLVYTTHSPYLINRNFPRRVRVVKKEDAEEGTQFIDNTRARRYEPVRTALGVDSAQSLFLGSLNILLEGATDQYALVECIREFSTPENMGDFIDLNHTSFVSAEGVTNIEQVLDHSQWADEPLPPTVVLLDGDDAGVDERKKLIGENGNEIINAQFVTVISDAVKPFGKNRVVLTIEDIFPLSIYTRAINNYIRKWLPDTFKSRAAEIVAELSADEFAISGVVASTKNLFFSIQPEFKGDYDKMGVLYEVIEIISGFSHKTSSADGNLKDDILELRKNVVAICDMLKEKLELSKAATGAQSAAQGIKRIVRDFQRLNKRSVSITAVQRMLRRLEREIAFIEDDAASLSERLSSWLLELEKLRAAGQARVIGDDWDKKWAVRIESMRKNPLNPRDSGMINVEAQPKAAKAVAPVPKSSSTTVAAVPLPSEPTTSSAPKV